MILLELIIVILLIIIINLGIIIYFKYKIDKECEEYQKILLKYHFDKTEDE